MQNTTNSDQSDLDLEEQKPLFFANYSILDLVKRLRILGFSISLTELIEAHQLLPLVSDIDEVRLGLRMIFCRSKQDQELFNLVWMNFYKITDRETGRITDQPGLQTNTSNLNSQNLPATAFADGIGEQITMSLLKISSKYKGIVRQLFDGNIRNAAAIMMRYMLIESLTASEIMVRQQDIREQVENMVADAVKDIDPDISDELMQQLDAELDQIIKENLENPPRMKRNPLKLQEIGDIPLITLSPSPELSHALKVMGKKLASKHRARKKGNKKINLRQTIRANIQRGGVMLELRKQKKRPKKPRLLILTDISPSTIHATRLFLSIIWNAKWVYSDIRYFEFIGSTIDVTKVYRRAYSVNDGIQASLEAWDKTIAGKENSDYYLAFLNFTKMTKNKLSKRDTIIILGDMRDWLGPWQRGTPLSAGVMGKLRKQVKKMIVLNPEPQNIWDSSDSICKYAEKEGLEVYETTNLNKLVDVLLKI
ncbi:MAG: VWA domain-containing protein [Candidatus Heimdallarchaeota archaeon]|nr:VWA domain-containing protein [Candidatus Heimdallarchaeota archaeon]